jgi:hypothetical protein
VRSLPAVLLSCLTACRAAPSTTSSPTPEPDPNEEASGAAARWSYEIRVDEQLQRMQVGLCIEGQLPRRLTAAREAIDFVTDARVRGGPELQRQDRSLAITTLGEHGCVDLEIDLNRAANASGWDTNRQGDTLMLAPDRWLWYPALVPDRLEARARFELPEGIAATVPWPAVDDQSGWRSLDRTSFGWNAWIALGHYQPLHFTAAECEFEVAVLDGERRATDAGIELWLRSAAEAVAQLYGRFPRERVSVVVIPNSSWGDTPILFGMARRGGGGSVMLLLNDAVPDEALPGEWVAVHELLHLGMPLVAEPWMSEGFVTYYTHVVRARRGLLDHGSGDQALAALELLHEGFEDRPSTRSLASASATMRQFGSYRRVYWGGAAVAFDLDVSIRSASQNRRSLDDLMLALWPLAPEKRRFAANDLLSLMDEEVARWYASGELNEEISPSAIAARHLRAKATPEDVQQLRGLAVDAKSSRLRLLANPIDEVEVRTGLFARK